MSVYANLEQFAECQTSIAREFALRAEQRRNEWSRHCRIGIIRLKPESHP